MESSDNRSVDGERGFVHVLIEESDVAARRDNLIGRRRQRNPGLASLERSYQVGFHEVHVGPVISVNLHKVELILDLGGTGIIPSFVVAALAHLRGVDRHNETWGVMRGWRSHEHFKSLHTRRRDHHHVGGAGLNAHYRD
jgi:hypothetical protein